MKPPLEFREGTVHGRAVFATRDIDVSERLLVESPIVSMALPESREALLACERCCRPVGSLGQQIQHLTKRKHLPAPMLVDDILAETIPCRRGCHVRFCSTVCANAEEHAHALLCSRAPAVDGEHFQSGQSLARFEEHAHNSNEVFLFGARIVAAIHAGAVRAAQTCSSRCRSHPELPPCTSCVAKARMPFDELCYIPFWDISDDGVACGVWINDAERLISHVSN